jgi:hypothetical protein
MSSTLPKTRKRLVDVVSRHYGQTMNVRQREAYLRHLFGLGPRPDPLAFTLADDNGRRHFVRRPATEQQAGWQAWHAEDWRATAAEQLARAPITGRRYWDRIGDRWDQHRAERRLRNARQLVFRSVHVHPRGQTVEVEGFFDFGQVTFPLQILAGVALERLADSQWQAGEVTHSENSLYAIGNWATVPYDNLDNDCIAEALRRWYQDRFVWQRGHWSAREGLPKITVDLAWQ